MTNLLWLRQPWRYLLDVNLTGTEVMRNLLEITTEIRPTSAITASAAGGTTDRIIALLHSLNAREYIAAPEDRKFLDDAVFRAAGITLRYLPEHETPPTGKVSILHRLFRDGPAFFR